MVTLKVISGPGVMQEYPLTSAKTILGRHVDCDIVLNADTISRQHAHILKLGENYFIEDLQSHNGTIVNGDALIHRTQLANNDEIRIGNISLAFIHDVELSNPSEDQALSAHENRHVQLTAGQDASCTIILSALDILATDTAVEMSGNHTEVKLRALLEVMHNLGSSLILDDILPKLIDSLFKIFPSADRGFIVIKNQEGHLCPKWAKVRRHVTDETLHISRAIIEHALNSKEAVLSEDAGSDQRFDASRSILAYQIHSVMCAPLINSDGDAFGVLQLDSLNQTQRFQSEDLEVLAGVASQAAIAINNARLHQQTLEQHLLKRDLELAHQVQNSFLPHLKPAINYYNFFSYYQAANTIGGDFYDYISLSDNNEAIAIIVADVVGHGIAAALLMAKLSAQVRYCLAVEQDPEKVIQKLNHSICDDKLDDRFITFVMMILEPLAHRVAVVNAGHMAPIIRRQNGLAERIGEAATGLPLGVMEGFDYAVSSAYLEPGEAVVMYTDGINESQNERGEFYGEASIEHNIAVSTGNATELGQSLINDVQAFSGQQTNKDDICLVCFSRNT